MYPILACSVFAVMIIIERFIYIAKVKKEADNIFTRTMENIQTNNIDRALQICEEYGDSIAGKIIRAGIIYREKSAEDIRNAIDEAGSRELPRIERFLPSLGTIIAIAPMLGLLGTVAGMIQSSNVLAKMGTSNSAELLLGISSALLTTAFGLIVAIPALIFYNYLVHKSQNTILEISKKSDEIAEILLQKKNGK